MAFGTYTWPAVHEFVDREAELTVLASWWADPDRTPLSLSGRRRCGKSWLLRRFAHGRPAVVLVAKRAALGAQLDDFSARLEPLLGVRPALTSLTELFQVLFRAASSEKLLVAIDEFPYLLPSTESETERELTAIAAAWEHERDSSQLKLILCGSLVAQMESLLGEGSPLHGRLRPMRLHPVSFAEARLFLPEITDPVRAFERFAITGGMPRYLSALGEPGPTADVVAHRVLSPNGALFAEGRALLEELREPKVYFSVLQTLADGDKESGEIVNVLRSDAQKVSKYLYVLEEMRLVTRRMPAGAAPGARGGHWHLRDPFLRFWFRFVFPYADDLETGLPASSLWDTEVQPALASHVGAEFEDYMRAWVRRTQGVSQVAQWWGNSLNALRKTGARTSEEIDAVGLARGRVTVVAEARWRRDLMDVSYLRDIEEFKLPALRQTRLKVARDVRIVLACLGGYTDALQREASRRNDLLLVEVRSALTEVSESTTKLSTPP